MTKKKSKWKFVSDRGDEEYAYVDGYDFGDKLLEGILFRIVIENNKFTCNQVDLESFDYFETLNKKMWFKSAVTFAKQNDIFIAPNGNSDAWIVDEEGNENPHLN